MEKGGSSLVGIEEKSKRVRAWEITEDIKVGFSESYTHGETIKRAKRFIGVLRVDDLRTLAREKRGDNESSYSGINNTLTFLRMGDRRTAKETRSL